MRATRWCVRSLAAAVVVTAGRPAAAQRPIEAAERASAGAPPIVRAVEIERENVFAQDSVTSWYMRAANAFHVTTKEPVVDREVLLRPGEPFDSALAAETERNLRKTTAFVDVRVDTVATDSGLALRVRTRDAWSFTPYMSYRVQGGQALWGIGITERNLLGRRIGATVRYKEDPDRTTKQFGVSAPRIVGNRLDASGNLERLSDGRRSELRFDAPFLTLDALRGGNLYSQYMDGRVFRFFDGDTVPRDTLRRVYAIARLEVGRAVRATTRGYTRVWVTAQLRREDFAPEADTVGPGFSPTGAAILAVESSRSAFVTVRDYKVLGPDEDVDLSTTVRLGASLAPRQWGYDHTGVGPLLEAASGIAFNRGFVSGRVRATSLYAGDGLDSATVTAQINGALQPTVGRSLIFHASGGWQRDPFPGNEFDLGLTFGPRGYPAHSFTGDRYFFLSGEYRLTLTRDMLGIIALGAAAFVDWGGAWWSGSPARDGFDAGVGVRVGSSRTPSSKGAARVDLVWRRAAGPIEGGWTVAIGSGFPFDRAR